MKLNLMQAKQLNNAFTPMSLVNMNWLPMKNLKTMDDSLKFQLALDTFKNWNEENKLKLNQQLQEFKNLKFTTKLLNILFLVLIVYILIASFFELPPTSYVINAYCLLFDTNKYHPILIGLIANIPCFLILYVINKFFK